MIVGVARGYQMRWTNVLGQKYEVRGATMDGSAIDEKNREVFEEVLEVVTKAWTQGILFPFRALLPSPVSRIGHRKLAG